LPNIFLQMNFLAHLYLSGEDEGLKLGNFIGDYIKGSKYLNYPPNIQKGIILHRRIDSYTDNHRLFREASKLFRQGYGRYSGIVLDLVFDHFLALNWGEYSYYKLRDFVNNTHKLLLANFRILPLRVKKFLPVFIYNRRLESYSTKQGIYRALELMSRYTSLPRNPDYAVSILKKENTALKETFFLFMTDIINYVESESAIKISRPGDRKPNSGTSFHAV